MFDCKQFAQLIQNTLAELPANLDSPGAVNLLLGTAAQESGFGTYLAQIRGPALGVFQMEPATETDIWSNWLAYRSHIKNRLKAVTGVKCPSRAHLHGNLLYQIVMARLHYLRCPAPLPAADDIAGMADYWKQHYNTPLGRGTVEEFISNYQRHVGNHAFCVQIENNGVSE
jgi:hypothetical protein